MELSQLEFEIKDNTISLVNEAGEGIIINIPENLDEHLSEGLEILSQVILSELPDSIDFDHTHSWDWTSFAPHIPPAAAQDRAGEHHQGLGRSARSRPG